MPLPWSFLLGLLALLTHEYSNDRLPTPATIESLLPAILIVPLPAVFAWWAQCRRQLWVRLPNLPYRALRILGLLQLLSVPAAYFVFLDPGQLPALALAWANGSHVLEFCILLAPLLTIEVSVIVAERLAAGVVREAGMTVLTNPFRLPLLLFLVAPILFFAVCMDLVFQDRAAEVFFSWTNVGGLLGFFVFVAVLCVLLPLLFRWLMPVSRQVPEFLLRTAQVLGFQARAVLLMHTGHRLVNAAMVGPLPWPRYLVLTDGILELLDPHALRGVVAHEVAHAKARHPLVLLIWFVLVPLLLVYAVMTIDLLEEGSVLVTILGAVAVIVGALALRVIAHRFEFEADQLSAEALGGAEPTIQALQRVSQLPGVPHRATWRHPSESERIRNLLACEQQPEHRARFHARGRKLRIATGAVLLVSLSLCIWAQTHRWPWDRAIVLLYTGQFRTASAAIEALPAGTTEGQRKLRAALHRRVNAAREFFPEGGEWSAIRPELGTLAHRKGLELLRNGEFETARSYLALGLWRDDIGPADQCLYLFADATAEGETKAADRIRKHMLETLKVDQATKALLD